MDTERLNKWADLLLDTGKRNNLINFKDSKQGTVEIVAPDCFTLFQKAEHSAVFEVYDPEHESDEDEPDNFFSEEDFKGEEKEQENDEAVTKQDYITKYAGKLSKNRILIYNVGKKPLHALKNIGRKAKTALEETGVNIAYIAFGFVHWYEADNSRSELKSPLLLVPVCIENRSAAEPYFVKVLDDEIIVNPTFSYKLLNDFGIKLPEYDEDGGLEKYLNGVSELISRLKWSVTAECKIGIFSFLKINMYKDLKENAGKIVLNDSIKALLGGDAGFGADEGAEQPNDLLSLQNVVDADSSQAEAVLTAKRGQSFVLQGPPGTGKSQTITNIIAECLSDGKKVLFVSEKLAALNVVYDKLKKVGLEEFCLELHSHKANKKQVIEELCRTLRLPKSGVSDKAEKQLKIKSEAMKQLDGYASELHKVRPVIERTLYQLFDEVSACRSAEDISYVIEDIKDKGESYIERAENLLNRYVSYANSVGADYRKNVWYGYNNTDGSYSAVAGLKSDLQTVTQLCRNLIDLNGEIKNGFGVSADNIHGAIALEKFFALACESGFITPSLIDIYQTENAIATVKELQALSVSILESKRKLDKQFDEDVYKEDGQQLYKKLTRQFKGIIPRIFGGEYRRLISGLNVCKKDGKKLKYAEAVEAVDILRQYQKKTEDFARAEESVKSLLGKAYAGVNSDFNVLSGELERLLKLLNEFGNLSSLSRMPKEVYLSKLPEFGRFAEKLHSILQRDANSLERLISDFDEKEYDLRRAPFGGLVEKLSACLADCGRLDNWCDFIKLLRSLENEGLRSFIDFSIDNGVEPKDIVLTYKKAFYSQWTDLIIHETPILSELSRVPHDEVIERFREKDVLNFEINKAKIKAKLSAQRPSVDIVAQGSAVSVLLREGEKKRKQKGIRQLLTEIGELAQTLKPCFLMSPLSVSTYLNADFHFDVVVFDEASQIFPQDAVGAIYRADRLIVVGDSKQMPPSNFFNSTVDLDDEDENEDITDFESILDLCSAAFPQRRLKWHYRSRYEQLISFSNKNFYDNDLITFPSSESDKKGTGVDYFFADGVFDRSTKTNRVEAERVADLVFEHIKAYPERSLGVVAFSISQQNLIDRIISKRRRDNAEYEEFFSGDRAEPFFVKNLETVQGDERDTIIFSVAYGRDAQGRLLLNFGPVNREGGERRLNVAVTRAKFNVQLVSSMHYYDIDLTRTKSEGARLLKEYLDYAENGGIALERNVSANGFESSCSDFALEVCGFLKENGYAVDTQVGASSFRIDIALKRSETSDYVMAIECDGAAYNSCKTARDRDRLRQDILERMGWKFYRVWSADWFRNKRVEQERLLKAVEAALENSDNANKNPDSQKAADEDFSESLEEMHFEFPEYKYVDEYVAVSKLGRSVLAVTRAIVEGEAPVSEEWLLKRIVFLFGGRGKVTNVVRTEFNRTMWGCQKYGIIRKDGFLYIEGREIPMLRVPAANMPPREIKYIEPAELAAGIKEILKQNVTAEKSGLFRILTKLLGFSRMGEAITERFEAALKLIEKEIEINGEMISLK